MRALLRRAGRAIACERGHTLIELLVASVVMIIVLGATLAILDAFHKPQRQNQLMNESQDRSRLALDGLARDLRNLASPTPGAVPAPGTSNAIEVAEQDDLVFWTVATVKGSGSQNTQNVRRVRYCLDSSTRRIYAQTQSWTTANAPSVPATVACPDPDPGWDASGDRVLAEQVVNRIGAQDRPVFLYDSGTRSDVTAIRSQLFVDDDPAKRPVESTLSTGVRLRNQDRAPIASIATPTVLADGSFRLNGSASTDPDGGILKYFWYVDGDEQQALGQAVTFDWRPQSAGRHDVKLVVEDPSGLKGQVEVCAPCS